MRCFEGMKWEFDGGLNAGGKVKKGKMKRKSESLNGARSVGERRGQGE